MTAQSILIEIAMLQLRDFVPIHVQGFLLHSMLKKIEASY